MVNNYALPDDYQARLQPQYFHDILENSHLWQSDVYHGAVKLARDTGAKRIVDIGCGRGSKLLPLGLYFQITGIDYGDNIQWCREAAPNGEWIESNLESEVIPSDTFQNAVVICADVIEHLINPEALVATFKNACQTAEYVLVSTPDRDRLYDGYNRGEPSNKAHVREWTLKELETWFTDEGLPVVWSGWTVSYAAQSHLNTSLIVLSSKHPERLLMPMNYQVAPRMRKPVQHVGNTIRVWMTPTPTEAARDLTNSINNIVCRLNQHLPDYGIELVEDEYHADVTAVHAGQGSAHPADVAIYHGLYPTAQGSENFGINASVIRNLRYARVITAPSNWVGNVIERDMHISPRYIGWGIDTDEWQPPSEHHEYIIWNKARTDNVSNPQIMLDLAAKAHDKLFLTTFGKGTPNVRTIGRQPYETMKNYVRHAAVYLSTNVETWGIGLWEAMASGVPILAFRQGAQAEYLTHGVNAFLVEPNDIDGLYEGLNYCLKYRDILGDNAREFAKTRPWSIVAKEFADVFHSVIKMNDDVRSHRIDKELYA